LNIILCLSVHPSVVGEGKKEERVKKGEGGEIINLLPLWGHSTYSQAAEGEGVKEKKEKGKMKR